jgi:uncharacterized protein
MIPPTHDARLTPQNAQPGDYLVLARDAAEVGDALMTLASAHWDYIDRFTSKLVARGPLLSTDGQEHTGSVHIITAASALDAQHFADEEPYHRANLYSSVTVTRFENLLGRTMWEQAPSTPAEYSSLLIANWPAQSCSAQQVGRLRAAATADKNWVFSGLILSTEGKCIGMVAAADLQPDAAENSLRKLLELIQLSPALIERSRWRRGGRQR